MLFGGNPIVDFNTIFDDALTGVWYEMTHPDPENPGRFILGQNNVTRSLGAAH